MKLFGKIRYPQCFSNDVIKLLQQLKQLQHQYETTEQRLLRKVKGCDSASNIEGEVSPLEHAIKFFPVKIPCAVIYAITWSLRLVFVKHVKAMINYHLDKMCSELGVLHDQIIKNYKNGCDAKNQSFTSIKNTTFSLNEICTKCYESINRVKNDDSIELNKKDDIDNDHQINLAENFLYEANKIITQLKDELQNVSLPSSNIIELL